MRAVGTVYGLKGGRTRWTAQPDGERWRIDLWQRARCVGSRWAASQAAAEAAMVELGAERLVRVPVYDVAALPAAWVAPEVEEA